MKSDPTNRSLRPFRPDARRSDRKTPIRTERLSADFPAGGADTCESESRSTSGTIPIRRTGSADLFRTACALLFLLPLLSGCDDIFEQDIDRARIEVVAPKHDAHIEAGEVTFLWRPLSGARNYRLTVVSPSFARASRVWADTTLRADSLHAAARFSLTLDEGDYQWSLQAFNGVYRSEESVYSLRVDPAAADESQSLSDPQEPAEEGDDMHEAFAVPGREGLSGSDGLAMPNPSTESAGGVGPERPNGPENRFESCRGRNGMLSITYRAPRQTISGIAFGPAERRLPTESDGGLRPAGPTWALRSDMLSAKKRFSGHETLSEP